MSDLELELTYLAKRIPAVIEGSKPARVIDVYIPDNLEVHARLRIRAINDTYSLTKKVQVNSNDASMHHEYSVPLTKDEFDEIIKVSNRRVVKDRYAVNISGHQAEVDVFKESLEGLVLIDFEFDQESQIKSFVPPEDCLVDVTQEEFIAGGYLAGRAYGNIDEKLTRFGYKKL